MTPQEIDLKYLIHIDNMCEQLYDEARSEIRLLDNLERAEAKKIETALINSPETEVIPRYTVLGNIQAYQVGLAGYIHQISKNKIITSAKSKEITHNLRKSLLQQEHFNKWYFAEDERFKKIKYFVRHFDYLRVLTVEYARNHCLNETN